MKVITICYVFTLVLPVQACTRADGESEKAPWRKLKHLSWSINELVNTADLIVEARLKRVDKFFSFGHRCLVMDIERTISGSAPDTPTYLAVPPPADAQKLSPAYLLPGAKYLLFLVHSEKTARAASELDVDAANVFAISGRWKGAIVLEVNSPEVCNRLLESRGLLPSELRRGAEPNEDSGRTTIETVQDLVAYRRPVPKGDREASATQQAALKRLRASEHPWAREFIRAMEKTVPE